MENQEREYENILDKYKSKPDTSRDKYHEYTRLKRSLLAEFGFIPEREYYLWTIAVCKALDI